MKKLLVIFLFVIILTSIIYPIELSYFTGQKIKKFKKVTIYFNDLRMGRITISKLKYYHNKGKIFRIRDHVDDICLKINKVAFVGYRIHDNEQLFLFFTNK